MFDRWLDSTRWWWCALSGLLLVACFPPLASATAGWIALVPAWWVITRSEKARRQPVRHGWFIGLVYFGGAFWWISNVTSVGTFFLILYLALYPAVWFLFIARLLGPRPGASPGRILFEAMAAAAFWVTLEWLRSWLFTGFNWDELGDSQSPSIVFRQLAAYGGVPLISFILVVVNVLWAEGLLGIVKTLKEKRVVRPSFPFAAALVMVAIAFAVGWHHVDRYEGLPPAGTIRFACIQPNIPQIASEGGTYESFQRRQDEALDKLQQLTVKAITEKPDLLLWPEAIVDEGIFQDQSLNDAVHGISMAFGGDFLLGSQDFDYHTKKLYNCAYLFGPGWGPFQYYQKTRLVILGEYLPFADVFPGLRKAIGIGIDFTPGDQPKRFVMTRPGVSFAPLICFEDTLPAVADKAARLQPDFFVTITNDGWYRGWYAAWGVRQHLAHAVFRCVEHDRPMLRCANTGISCVIDQNGTVVDRYRGASGADIDVGGIYAGALSWYPPRETFYEAWGDWIVLISALFSLMMGIRLGCRFFQS